MGFEISVAAGLVSQFTPFRLHTSLLTPRTWKQEIIRSSRDQEASFVWRIFLHSSFGQLFKLRTEAVTGVGGVCSENCKENHRVQLPSGGDVADTDNGSIPSLHIILNQPRKYFSISTVEIYCGLAWATACSESEIYWVTPDKLPV